ncbi:hypothetical protein PPYR_01793 [Photinus pyralis]|uniref:Acyltransferase 3 domain-containing protein n=1 Tax=Photinus pyralis TaxID=7054 RepID=A0A5N4B5J9_PHOPY|nr:O-acyltransferase like protein-like [Photinus pyralis]KAB0804823.1 hypothetical protein PPYR_01793 [Photinus pyralis]
MMLMDGLVLLSTLIIGVFAEVSEGNYALMPELFHLDDFDRCLMLGENALYCTFKMQLAPLDEAADLKVWETMQELNSSEKNFRHDWLRHGICVPFTCPNVVQNRSTNKIRQNEISDCYSTKLKGYGLKGHVTEIHCETEKSLYRVDYLDIIVAIVLLSLLVVVMYSSLYEGFARYKSKEDYDRITSTKYGKIIQCFSIPKNWDRLTMVHTDPDTNQLKCMTGMRFFSMIAVVVCHSVMVSASGFVSNPQYIEKMTSDPKSMSYINCHPITQTFFVMSGWLLSYHFFLSFEKANFQFTHILYAFIHRYVRLTIPLAVVVAITATWLPHFARGPLWDQVVGREYRSCRKNWWANLLYINNYYEEKNMCLPHSWYLAADIQLFLYSLLLLSIIWKNRRIASKVFAASLIMGVLVPGILAYIHDLHIVVRVYPEYLQTGRVNLPEWSYFMVPGHNSIGGYTIGLIGGYLFYQNRHKKLFTKMYQHIVWFVIAMAFPLTVIFLDLRLHDYTPSSLETAIYVGLARNLYAFGMCLMIFGFTQNGGWLIKDIVMIPSMQFFGKFSYCVYLVHVTIIHIRSGRTRSPIYISDPETIHGAIGDVVISTVFGVVLCLFVEMPTSALEKLIMSKERKSKVG